MKLKRPFLAVFLSFFIQRPQNRKTYRPTVCRVTLLPPQLHRSHARPCFPHPPCVNGREAFQAPSRPFLSQPLRWRAETVQVHPLAAEVSAVGRSTRNAKRNALWCTGRRCQHARCYLFALRSQTPSTLRLHPTASRRFPSIPSLTCPPSPFNSSLQAQVIVGYALDLV